MTIINNRLSKKYQATESIDVEQAKGKLQVTEVWTNTVLARLDPILPPGRLRILEIGAAQGRSLIALSKAGYDAYRIEPYAPAIEVAYSLAEQEKVTINLNEGCAEQITFESGYFDLVLAFSVMEHVDDLELSLKEIARVIKPGGIFWFNSASAMCPIQDEIKGFPLFGWYPD